MSLSLVSSVECILILSLGELYATCVPSVITSHQDRGLNEGEYIEKKRHRMCYPLCPVFRRINSVPPCPLPPNQNLIAHIHLGEYRMTLHKAKHDTWAIPELEEWIFKIQKYNWIGQRGEGEGKEE